MDINELRELKSNLPQGCPTKYWITQPEYQELFVLTNAMVEATPEEDLSLIDLMTGLDKPMTEEEKEALPAGSLLRDEEHGVRMKVFLDLWAPWSIYKTPRKVNQALGRYGIMRLEFLEHYRVWDALEMGERLLEHCLSIQEEGQELEYNMMQQFLKSKKPWSTMDYYQELNMHQLQVQEIVTREVAYREPNTGAKKPNSDWRKSEELERKLDELTGRIIARMRQGEAGIIPERLIPYGEIPF